jgi:hypothetical protein
LTHILISKIKSIIIVIKYVMVKIKLQTLMPFSLVSYQSYSLHIPLKCSLFYGVQNVT